MSKISKSSFFVTSVAALSLAVGCFKEQTRDDQNLKVTLPSTNPIHLSPVTTQVQSPNPIDAGRYLVKIGGCNDCHTPLGPNHDLPPESQWLTGSPVGFRGPWGTTYGSNLRLFVGTMSEADFVKICRERNSRPPMPWASLHAMADGDLRALYQYIKSLGDPGKPAPAYVPPGEEPTSPYFVFEPVMPKKSS